MRKSIFLFVLITLLFLLGVSPAKASGLPGLIYVDTSLTTNGDGTLARPYNNYPDAINKGRSLSGGAWINEKQNGIWQRTIYVSPVYSGGTGLPLPMVSLYVLLAVAALVMAVVGLQLRRRSRQLQH